MKIYYSTDGSVDDNLEQVCPFGEKHHFKREDGSEYELPKYVGCGGCVSCKHCYGAGFHPYYGCKADKMALVPRNIFATEEQKEFINFEQFYPICEDNYVRCSLCFTEAYRNKPLLRFRRWWWHCVGNKWNNFRCDVLYKWNELKNKWHGV